MLRRWTLAFAALLVVAVLLVVTLPWWLGLALPRVAARYGVTFTHYVPLGYARFALDDVVLRRNGVVVTISRIESATPLVWLWNHSQGGSSPVVAGRWSVVVGRRPPPPKPVPRGWVPLRAKLERIATELDRWLPVARTGAGSIEWTGGGLKLQAADWQKGTLAVRGLQYRAVSGDVTLVTTDEAGWRLVVRSPHNDAVLALDARRSSVTGDLSWWGQPVGITARFGPGGWLPQEAVFQSGELNLPGARVKLGAMYAAIRGHARVAWVKDHFLADIAVRGQPVAHRRVPPLFMTVRGRGDARAFTIDALHVALPGVTANLSAPVTIDRRGRIAGANAAFWVYANLAQQHWFNGTGVVTGDARVVPNGTGAPTVQFEVNGGGLVVDHLALRGAGVHGHFNWPRLEVDRFNAIPQLGDEVRGSGGWDFRTKQLLDASAHGTLHRAVLARWLPATVQFDQVSFAAQASGPLTKLQHSGRFDATKVKLGVLNPMAVSGTWRGGGTDITRFKVQAVLPHARVAAAGSADRTGARLEALNLFEGGREQLHLTQPARIAWRPQFTIEHLRLEGPSAAVQADVSWGPAGRIQGLVRGIGSTEVANVFPLHGPGWSIASLAVAGSWNHGPMTYSAAGTGRLQLPGDRVADVSVSLRGSPEGLRIDALHGLEGGNPVVNATGRIPLIVNPAARPLVSIRGDGALALDATSVPDSAFWSQLSRLSGIDLRRPELSAHFTGTWNQPRGRLNLRVAHAAMDPRRFARPWPAVDHVDLSLVGDPDGLRLDRLSLRIEGQIVNASGRLPVAAHGWAPLLHDPLEALRRGAQFQLVVPDAQVAMFSRFLPAALAPAGRVQADIRYDRGRLGGYLRLRNAASRPLGPLGVLQQVNADIAFTDDRVELRRVTATSGGEPVVLTGSVELPDGGAAQPRYHVVLRGRNLPFVRQAGLLVRGDVDLRLESPPKGPPAIEGKVTLRDSLFLTDVRAFLPHGGGASPARRPPYFSVNTPPLDTWTLAVDVTGTRFLRLRTPVFSGLASTRFHLGGTLGAPRATGEAVIDRGQVLMPFTTFKVTQGSVRLTEEDPYQPTIYLLATGEHYGYDLTMEIKGKASAPDITFTSSPALDSEQVLLMVMTGAAPSDTISTSATHRAVQIGAYFGQSLLGGLTGSAASENRLSIESGEKVSREGKETYNIEYRLNNRWSLTGEYDQWDDYNVGFKWRVSPKKWPKGGVDAAP